MSQAVRAKGAVPAHELLTATQLEALWAAQVKTGRVRAVQPPY